MKILANNPETQANLNKDEETILRITLDIKGETHTFEIKEQQIYINPLTLEDPYLRTHYILQSFRVIIDDALYQNIIRDEKTHLPAQTCPEEIERETARTRRLFMQDTEQTIRGFILEHFPIQTLSL